MMHFLSKKHFGFADPLTLISVAFLLLTTILGIGQVFKTQNINEKAAGGCTNNPAQCSASEKCVNGVCKKISTLNATNNQTENASTVVPKNASECTGTGYAWCGGCGGFCIQVNSTSCNQEALKRCGEQTVYTGPACNSSNNGAVVVNGGSDNNYYVICDGTSWKAYGDRNCTSCLSKVSKDNVPSYLISEYVLATTPVITPSPKPTPSTLNQAINNTNGINPFTTDSTNTSTTNSQTNQTTVINKISPQNTPNAFSNNYNPFVGDISQSLQPSIDKSVINNSLYTPTPFPTPKIAIPVPKSETPPKEDPITTSTVGTAKEGDSCYDKLLGFITAPSASRCATGLHCSANICVKDVVSPAVAITPTKIRGDTCTDNKECTTGLCAKSYFYLGKLQLLPNMQCVPSFAEQDAGIVQNDITKAVVTGGAAALTLAPLAPAIIDTVGAKLVFPTLAEKAIISTATNIFAAGTSATLSVAALDCATNFNNGQLCDQGRNMAVMGFATDPVQFSQSVAQGTNFLIKSPRMLWDSIQVARTITKIPVENNIPASNTLGSGNTVIDYDLNTNNISINGQGVDNVRWVKSPSGVYEPVVVSSPTNLNLTPQLTPVTNSTVVQQQNQAILNTALGNWIKPVNALTPSIPSFISLNRPPTTVATTTAGSVPNSPFTNLAQQTGITPPTISQISNITLPNANNIQVPPITIAPTATTTQNPVVAFVNDKIVQPVTNVAKNAWELVTTGGFGQPLPAGTVVNTNESVTSGVKLVSANPQVNEQVSSITSKLPKINTGESPIPLGELPKVTPSKEQLVTVYRGVKTFDPNQNQKAPAFREVPDNIVSDVVSTVKSDPTINFEKIWRFKQSTNNVPDPFISMTTNKDLAIGYAGTENILITLQIPQAEYNALLIPARIPADPALQGEVIAFGYIKPEWITKVENLQTGEVVFQQDVAITPPTPPTSITQTVINSVKTGITSVGQFLGLTPKPPAAIPVVAPSVPNSTTEQKLDQIVSKGNDYLSPQFRGGKGLGCRGMLCETSSDFIVDASNKAGLPSQKFEVRDLNIARGIPETDSDGIYNSFGHYITIITDPVTNNKYLVDLTFNQFVDPDRKAIRNTNRTIYIGPLKNYPIAQELIEKGYIKLTDQTLNDYLNMTTKVEAAQQITIKDLDNLKTPKPVQPQNSIPSITSPTLTNPITTSTNISDNMVIETVQDAWTKVKGTISPVDAQLNKIVTDVKGINNITTAEQVADLKLGQCVRDSIMCRIALGPNPDSQVVIFVNTNGTYHAALEVMNGPKSLGYLETSTGEVVQLPYYTDAGYTVYTGPVNMSEVNGLDGTPSTQPVPESTSGVVLPKLANPPAGVVIEKPLNIEGVTKSSDIYIGKGVTGEERVFVIARTAENIKDIQVQVDFLNTNLPPQNFTERFKPRKIQDFSVTNSLLDYKISGKGGKYEDYTITTRFVRLDSASTSPQMLASGQIAEEHALGEPMIVDGLNKKGEPVNVVNRNLPAEVHAAVFMNYLDFSIQLEKLTGKFLDVNIEKDLLIQVDDNLKQINVTRVDPSPFDIGSGVNANDNKVADYISSSVTNNYADPVLNPASFDFAKGVLSNRFLGMGEQFKNLPPEKQTLEGLKELILGKDVAPFTPP